MTQYYSFHNENLEKLERVNFTFDVEVHLTIFLNLKNGSYTRSPILKEDTDSRVLCMECVYGCVCHPSRVTSLTKHPLKPPRVLCNTFSFRIAWSGVLEKFNFTRRCYHDLWGSWHPLLQGIPVTLVKVKSFTL